MIMMMLSWSVNATKRFQKGRGGEALESSFLKYELKTLPW